MIRLPTVPTNIPIVDGSGRMTTAFSRFLLDFKEAVEKQEAEQEAAIAAIQAAQATADEALERAEQANGSKYTRLDSAPGGSTALSTVNDITPNTRLQLSGGLVGGSLSSNTSWVGQAEFFENNGTTTHSLGVVPISTESSGLDLGGGVYQAENGSIFVFDVVGTYSGSVTYSVSVTRTSGSTYVAGASINSSLTLTPKAT